MGTRAFATSYTSTAVSVLPERHRNRTTHTRTHVHTHRHTLQLGGETTRTHLSFSLGEKSCTQLDRIGYRFLISLSLLSIYRFFPHRIVILTCSLFSPLALFLFFTCTSTFLSFAVARNILKQEVFIQRFSSGLATIGHFLLP